MRRGFVVLFAFRGVSWRLCFDPMKDKSRGTVATVLFVLLMPLTFSVTSFLSFKAVKLNRSNLATICSSAGSESANQSRFYAP